MVADEGAPEGMDLLSERSQWLWSQATGSPGEEDAEDELEVGLEEFQDRDSEVQARHSCSRRTHSKVVPLEVSPSGRVYQTVRHSRMEYSGPTMSIKSQWSLFSSSARPLPRPQVPSLMSWTPIAKLHPSLQPSTSSPSPRVVSKLIKRG
ncbi:movement protein P4 [Pterostylis polerovirus]|nr:movement protein P4 [Pterostylis polerovirus]